MKLRTWLKSSTRTGTGEDSVKRRTLLKSSARTWHRFGQGNGRIRLKGSSRTRWKTDGAGKLKMRLKAGLSR